MRESRKRELVFKSIDLIWVNNCGFEVPIRNLGQGKLKLCFFLSTYERDFLVLMNRRSLSAFPVSRRLERPMEVAAQVGERTQPVEEMKRPAAAGRARAL